MSRASTQPATITVHVPMKFELRGGRKTVISDVSCKPIVFCTNDIHISQYATIPLQCQAVGKFDLVWERLPKRRNKLQLFKKLLCAASAFVAKPAQ